MSRPSIVIHDKTFDGHNSRILSVLILLWMQIRYQPWRRLVVLTGSIVFTRFILKPGDLRWSHFANLIYREAMELDDDINQHYI